MISTPRNISQRYWTSKLLPNLTIRTTRDSTQCYKSHYHSEFSIGIIESGETCLSLPKERIMLKRGDIVLIEPNMVHACNPVDGKPRSYHMLYVDKEWCCDVLAKLFECKVKHFVIDQGSMRYELKDRDLKQLLSSFQKGESVETASMIEKMLFEMLSRCCSPKKDLHVDDKLAVKIKERLLENVEHPPSLEVIATELEQTKETVIRRFKSHFGITPKSFLNNHRIEKAKLLLRNGMPIVDVAIEVGFSDQSQLHRAFVNYTASTPRQYQSIKSIFDNNS